MFPQNSWNHTETEKTKPSDKFISQCNDAGSFILPPKHKNFLPKFMASVYLNCIHASL